jgi:sterol desaturase/sphingolipid hydroxylase (fatty acid hydroxylase superfamily)
MRAAAFELLLLMAVFTFLEDRWPSSRAHRWWRRPLLVDLLSWTVHPLSISAGLALAVAITRVLPGELFPDHDWATFSSMRAHVAALPFLAQTAIAIVIADLLDYWIHRAYHRFPLLWGFHIVHHTSEELDWLSTSRLHPASQTLNTAVVGVTLLSMGLPLPVVVMANVFTGAAALLSHANVNWTFGPLQHLFVSPLFHQWHHARIDGNVDGHGVGNYGAIFSIWDRMFGTWSVPKVSRPRCFGVEEAPAPTVIGLVMHPLRVCLQLFSNTNRAGCNSIPADCDCVAKKPGQQGVSVQKQGGRSYRAAANRLRTIPATVIDRGGIGGPIRRK